MPRRSITYSPKRRGSQPNNTAALRRIRIRIIDDAWKRVVARYTGATQ